VKFLKVISSLPEYTMYDEDISSPSNFCTYDRDLVNSWLKRSADFISNALILLASSCITSTSAV
jgi:hypothetical protein